MKDPKGEAHKAEGGERGKNWGDKITSVDFAL